MSQSVSALNLKDFFTLTETAKQLSHAFNTVVVESDVVRLSLDGRLPLTMYTKDVMARHGVLVPYEDTKWIKGPSLLELKGYPVTVEDYEISREEEISPFYSKQSVIKIKTEISASDEKPTCGMRSYILATHRIDGVLYKKLIKPNFASFSSKPDEKHFSEMLRHQLGVDCTLEYINFRSSSHAYINGLWSFPLSEGNAQILERRYFELCTENSVKQWNIPAGKEQTICLERDNEFCVLTDSEQTTDCGCPTNQPANVLDAYSADYGNDTTELVRHADDMADLMLELPENPAHELPVGCFFVVKTKDIENFLRTVIGCKDNPSTGNTDTPTPQANLAMTDDNTPR